MMLSGNQFHNLSVCQVNKLYLCCLIISFDSNSFSSVRNSEKSLSDHLFHLLSDFIDLYLPCLLTSILEVKNVFLLILSSCQTHFMLLIIFLHFFFKFFGLSKKGRNLHGPAIREQQNVSLSPAPSLHSFLARCEHSLCTHICGADHALP